MIRILVFVVSLCLLACHGDMINTDAPAVTPLVELRLLRDRIDYSKGDTLMVEAEVENLDTVTLRLPLLTHTFWLELDSSPYDSLASQFLGDGPYRIYNLIKGTEIEWVTIKPNSSRGMALKFMPDDLSVLKPGSEEFRLGYIARIRDAKDTLYNIVSKNRLILEIK